ncbi:hypothetical protein CL634_09275 [bacterium]|nr:hypothetical protein [bacterium]
MKICVVAYKFGTAAEIGSHLGTYQYLANKLKYLSAQGHEVQVVAPWISFTKSGSRTVSGVKVTRTYPPLLPKIYLWPFNRLVRRFYIRATQQAVKGVVNKIKPDVVYVWQARESGFAIAKIKKSLGCPFIFRQITTWHWHWQRRPKEIFENNKVYKIFKSIGLGFLIDPVLVYLLDHRTQKKYASYIYKKADQVVFLSEAALAEANQAGLPDITGRTKVLPIAVDHELFKPSIPRPKDLKTSGSKTVLYVGRLNFPEKGIGYLLEAVSLAKSKVPSIKLVIVGAGSPAQHKELEQRINQLNLKNHVLMVGKKPLTSLPAYQAAVDLAAIPSVWMEAFGAITIQAMSCGTPVVTSDAGASPEINIDGQTGLVVKAADSQALARALIKLLSDSKLSKKMGEAARARVLAMYTYKAVANKFLDLVREIK